MRPSLMRRKGKEKLLKRAVQREREGERERKPFYLENFKETGRRENKLGMGEDRMGQRMSRGQKVKTDG